MKNVKKADLVQQEQTSCTTRGLWRKETTLKARSQTTQGKAKWQCGNVKHGSENMFFFPSRPTSHAALKRLK